MNLLQYMDDQRGRASELAGVLGVPLSYLSQMASGNRAISAARAMIIETFTDGAVSRREMRTKDWWVIWPELIDKKHPAPAEEGV